MKHGKLKQLLIISLFVLGFAFTSSAAEFGPGYTGWHQCPDGTWQYFESGVTVVNDWRFLDGVNYYFDVNGTWVENAVPETKTEETAAAEEETRPNPYPQWSDVVEVDIAGQHVYCYRGNKLVWDAPCVTGCVKDGHDTPQGVFQIQNKERSRYLTGPRDASGKPAWKNWVEYWMPFHGGCGLHDASWRQKFAGTIYQYGGSHGCVNLPSSKAGELYDLVFVGMPVVVHA